MTAQLEIATGLTFHLRQRGPTGTLMVCAVLAIVLTISPIAGAQTFAVLHEFTNGVDGVQPEGGLTLDRAGNLYGTVSIGGTQHYGAVFKIRIRAPAGLLIRYTALPSRMPVIPSADWRLGRMAVSTAPRQMTMGNMALERFFA